MFARIETYFTDISQEPQVVERAIETFSEDFRQLNSILIPLPADFYPEPETNIAVIIHTPQPNPMANAVPHLEEMADNLLQEKKIQKKRKATMFIRSNSKNTDLTFMQRADSENIQENFLHQRRSTTNSSSTLSSSSNSTLSSSSRSSNIPTLWKIDSFDENQRRRVAARHVVLHRMLCEAVTLHAAINFEIMHQIYDIDNRRLLRNGEHTCVICLSRVYNAHNLVANENCFVKTTLRSISPTRCCCIVVNGMIHCGHCLSSFEHVYNTKEAFNRMMSQDLAFLNEIVE
jgi:hypothetical protein